ncbi:MAG: pyrrolo-quinoline quinone [Gemmataceae bacterium]|nr:pyrrolo-quinoline quinone [Gemmataceae bacterium]
MIRNRLRSRLRLQPPVLRPALEALEPRLTPSADVLTYHNDNGRTGLNDRESVLTPQNVNSATFGQVFTARVDGQIYAQPLVLSNVSVPGQGAINLVFVATEHDSVYAFNADRPGAPIWHDSFIDPVAGITTIPAFDGTGAIAPEVGITSTPVIDPASGTIYVVATTKTIANGVSSYVQQLHALDVATGAEKFGGPTAIADTQFDGATYTYVSGPSVPGTGYGSVGGTVHFNAVRENPQPGLLLLGGAVYIAWASSISSEPFQGWVVGYNAGTLQPVPGAVFATTPNGSGGGISMSGGGLAADSQGNIYFSTGNGTFDVNQGGTDYGDSIVKLSTQSGLSVADYFTPSNQAQLAAGGINFGSGGVLLLPDQPGPTPHLLVQSSETGTILVVNRDAMGGYSSTTDHVVQELPNALGKVSSTPAYFNGSLDFNGSSDVLKAFQLLASGSLTPTPTSRATTPFGFPGATPSISANGTQDGIVWTLQTDAYPGGPAVLHAYDASDLSKELYNSNQAANGRDKTGIAIPFAVPTVANGRVYVGTNDVLSVYGLLPTGRPQVFNTGVDANGNLLPDEAVDPHYTLVSSADPITPGPNTYVVLQAAQDPIPPWYPDGPSSKWIAPQPFQSGGSALGRYVYQTQVDLTNFIPSTAFLSGQTAADNDLLDVLVNGVSTGINDTVNQFNVPTPYSIDGRYFHAGVNTLDFIVFNGGTGLNPTGFRNEMTVTAWSAATTTAATATPTSSTYGQSVTLTASVSGAPAATPTGTVQFTAGSIDLGTAPLSGGTATLTTTRLPAGTDTVTATYSGDTVYNPSSGTARATVTPAALTVTADSLTAPADTPLPALTYTVTGLVNGDTPGVISGIVLSTAATPASPPGMYAIDATGGQATNYSVTVRPGVLTLTLSASLVGTAQFAVGPDAGGPGPVTVYNPDRSVAATLTPFPGFAGGVRTAVGDFNGDGVSDVAVGTGPGVVAEVKVLDGKTGTVLFNVTPFGAFTGGVFVAAGTIVGNGKTDLVITPDQSGGPRVEVFEGGDFKEIANFFGIDDPNFRGGARAAVGDINGDGHADLIVSAGFGGGPRISVFDGAALLKGQFVHPVPDFLAFEPALRNGAYVAVGDVTGDGTNDLVFGAGPGGGPRVLIISGRTLLTRGATAAIGSPIANFFAGGVTNRGGIRVAVKNLDNDPYADVITGAGPNGGSGLTAYLGKNLATGSATVDFAFDGIPGFSGGVFVG